MRWRAPKRSVRQHDVPRVRHVLSDLTCSDSCYEDALVGVSIADVVAELGRAHHSLGVSPGDAVEVSVADQRG
jgi:hypothetical protein